MPKHIQLNIADPCHENWDNMSKSGQGRFCASCQKQVIDFSSMSDSQVATFFKKPSTGSVCGRFFNDQLDKDIEIPRKRIPWVKYFFQFVLPAFMISMKATAQGKVSLSKKNSITMPEIVLTSVIKPAPLNENSIAAILRGNIHSLDITINNDTANIASCVKSTPQLLKTETMNSINIFVGGAVVFKKVTKKKIADSKIPNPISLLTQKIMDTASKFFKIFPNPVSSGAGLNIEWKEMQEGYYLLELFELSGKKVYSKETWVDTEARVLNIEVPTVAAGNYFLRVSNKESGKNFTEKVIIQ